MALSKKKLFGSWVPDYSNIQGVIFIGIAASNMIIAKISRVHILNSRYQAARILQGVGYASIPVSPW